MEPTWRHPRRWVKKNGQHGALLVALVVMVWSAFGVMTKQGWAQTSATASWQASYWDNNALSGAPVLQRVETSPNHDWGLAAPAPGVGVDRFSARWTATLPLPAGRYRFTVRADDGARLWVDEQLIIDDWLVAPAQARSVEAYVGGETQIRLEYFENTGFAQIRLDWTFLSGFPSRWQAQYYNNAILTGGPALERQEQSIDYDWGFGSPAPGIEEDTFSARWVRSVTVPPGRYRFSVTADDGVRLWVDSSLLIDAWREQSATTYSAEISLPGGVTPLMVTYFEADGLAEIELNWVPLSLVGRLAEPVVVDDATAGFDRGGLENDWLAGGGGYGGSFLRTHRSDQPGATSNWARWYPSLVPGRYVVSAFVPNQVFATRLARYWVSHADGATLHTVDQSARGGEWVELGTYDFAGTGDEHVSLSDVTGEGDERLVAFDAMRWVPYEVSDGTMATVFLDPAAGPAQTRVTAVGRGFPPEQLVTAQVVQPDGEPYVEVASGLIDADGSVALTFRIPELAPTSDPDQRRELAVVLVAQDGTSATARFLLAFR